ncbi:MAG: tetratricopeptide repeat protein [Bacteroidota bacterium]
MKTNKYLRILLLGMVLFGISINSKAQNDNQANIRILRDSLAVAKEDTNMVLLVMTLYEMQGGFNSANEVKTYLEKALLISQQQNYLKGLAFINENLGDFNTYLKMKGVATGYFLDAKQFFFVYLNLRIQQKDSFRIAANYTNLARIYTKLDMPDSAKIFLEKGVSQIIETKKDYAFAAEFYMKIANTNGMLGNYSQALSFHNKGLNLLLINSPDSLSMISQFYQFISFDFQSMNKMDSAQYYNKLRFDVIEKSQKGNDPQLLITKGQNAYSLQQYKEALSLFQKALNNINKDDFFQIALCHTYIGNTQHAPLYERFKNGVNIPKAQFALAVSSFETANDFFRKALENSTDSSSIKQCIFYIAGNKIAIGDIVKLYQDSSATNNFEEAVRLLRSVNDGPSRSNMKYCYKQLGLLYASSDRLMAINMFKKAMEICQEFYATDTTWRIRANWSPSSALS